MVAPCRQESDVFHQVTRSIPILSNSKELEPQSLLCHRFVESMGMGMGMEMEMEMAFVCLEQR